MSAGKPDPPPDKTPVYRRYPKTPFDESFKPPDRISSVCFRPSPRDTDGLSLTCDLQRVGDGCDQAYVVLQLTLEELRDKGITVIDDPREATETLPADPGHLLIPELCRQDK